MNGTQDDSNCGDNLAIDLGICFDNGVNDSKSEQTISLAWDNLVKDIAEFVRTEGGKMKSAKIRTASYLEKEAKRMNRKQSPTCNPIEKFAQLELHERLHVQYESGKLKKCALSYYIHVMTKKRRKLLHYIGSDMAVDKWNDPEISLPERGLSVGLTMIPNGWCILADKRFAFVSRHFPHFNPIDTPTWLGGRKHGHYESYEVKRDRKNASFIIRVKIISRESQKKRF